ncbi:MAG: helix-turn-helix domain-containing protein [Kofleriaceae bacterium]
MARSPRSAPRAVTTRGAAAAAPTPELALRAALRPQAPTLTQERARRSYEALLDAAERLFADQGFDAVGTPEIAAAAGVSVGTCYRYFDDKKQLFLEVIRRYLLNACHRTLDRLTPERFVGKARHETIEETLGVLFDYVHRQPGLNRVLVEMSLRDEDTARLRASFEAASCQQLARLIAATCPPEVVSDPEATAWVIQSAALECAVAVSSASPGALVTPPRARRALTEMIERLLFP